MRSRHRRSVCRARAWHELARTTNLLCIPYFVAIAEALGEHAWAMLPILVAAGVAQTMWPATRRSPKYKTREFWLDAFYSLQPTLIGFTAFGVATTTASVWLHSVTPAAPSFIGTMPFLAQVLLAVWAFDFVVYWRHRLEHEVAPLWYVHAVHHTSRQIDVLTTTRLHFLEVMAGGALAGWVGACLGVDATAAAVGFALYLRYNYFIHCNVRVRFSGWRKYIFVSPFMHRWHHASELEARNSNYGVVFAWNDWIFRSAYHPEEEPQGYGLEVPDEEAVTESYWAQQAYPFRILYLRLRALARRRPEMEQDGQ